MVMTVKEAAEYVRLPESTVYEYIRKHVIPALTIGRHVRIHKEELEKALEAMSL